MPEGDTIHRTAARLRPALEGKALISIEGARLARPRPVPGTMIESVEAQGKHLLVRFADGHVLDTHMGMTGSWHLYERGARWRTPRHLARVVLEVDGWTAVCFAAPTVRLVAGESAARAVTAHLGPDLCRDDADLDVVVARMASVPAPTTGIAEVLLDQRVAAGIGNVYKSEVLWACRLSPFTPIETVDLATRRRLVATAARQLRANLGAGPRTTVPGPPGSLAVYGRARQPCRRCGTPIRVQRTGEQHRSTYWCPTCQPASR